MFKQFIIHYNDSIIIKYNQLYLIVIFPKIYNLL